MKKAAIVTGASRGIGYAVAQRLARDGFMVAIVATRTREQCAEHLKWFDAQGLEYTYIQADVSSAEDRGRIVKETVEAFGRIDILVNNAGVAPNTRSDLLDMTGESFDRVLNINLKSNMFLTQLVAKQMLSQAKEGSKRGTIVNISSCSAEVVSVNRGEYCVSKAGISMLTRLYAARLAEEDILVHEIRPGVIATDMTAGVKEKYDQLVASGTFPIKRWGTPEDVANAVGCFCGEDFIYTTGNHIDIDGGFHIKRL